MHGETYWRSEIEKYHRMNLTRNIPMLKFLDTTHGIAEVGHRLFVACTNDYLGLRFHPEVIESAQNCMRYGGFGSSGARLTTGAHPLANQLERELAAFKRSEAALIFNTGYMANIGLISTIGCNGDVIFSDEKNHASIIDGCKLSHGKVVIYPHRDVNWLQKLLNEHRSAQSRFIITEGVFSMDGTVAPLPELLQLAESFDAHIIIDDAHSLGVLGERGHGTLEYFNVLPNSRIVQVGTCSKALGSLGGFVCGTKCLIQYLCQHSRPFICSTMLPSSMLAASSKALQILQSQPERVYRLKRFSEMAKSIFSEWGMAFPPEAIAILPIVIGDETTAMKIFENLYQQGIYLAAIRYPSVPLGHARLRLSVCSEYEEDEWKDALFRIVNTIKTIAGNSQGQFK
ncbi:MAG: aminotransferase class I/II-fold pyridoxal phosphate-dependent enzyme [Puniceicoccales bacterium]|jgi:8-amino-7-oxononanoate synthase|nr:aminotransferase class I/II-fold pyridoxal phosphate-dependent enzyme [Puniceicoccales bacterium]